MLYTYVLDNELTPEDEVDSQVFSGRESLHEVVGRILGNLASKNDVSHKASWRMRREPSYKISNVKQSNQQTVLLPFQMGLSNHAVCRGIADSLS